MHRLTLCALSVSLGVSACFPTNDPIEVKGNDTCETAYVLSEGTEEYMGDGRKAAANQGAACTQSKTVHDGPDVHFRFSLPQRSRVHLSTEGSEANTVLALRSSGCGTEVLKCADSGSSFGFPSDTSYKAKLTEVLEPGDYTAELELASPATYELLASIAPVQAVVSNDSCDKAVSIPKSGGYFEVSGPFEARAFDPDCGEPAEKEQRAVFKFTLDERSLVSAGASGHEFYVYQGSCTGKHVMCGAGNQYTETLEAGTYYMLVAGEPDYSLDVLIVPNPRT